MMKKNYNDFYADLDKVKRKESCGCGPMLVFLLFLFFSGVYIVWWGIGQIKQKIYTPEVSISETMLRQAENKLQLFLKGSSTKGNQITMTLTEQELTSLLVKSEVLAQDDNYYLDNPQANISPDGIIITGQLRKPIKSHLTINGNLVVENGNLNYKVTSLRAGKLEVPAILSKGLESLIERLIITRLSNSNIQYQQVTTIENELTITGITK